MALRERLDRISRMNAPSNEQETITQIISPILEDLGWDVYNDRETGEVKPEYRVGSGKEGGQVDIALMEGDQCVCVVEAKRPSVKLIGAVDQVLRYAFYEGATFCVLTNGLEWRLYLPLRKVRPEEREFAVLKLKENPIESENDLKRFLYREAVLSGDAERDADRQLKQRQIDRELPDIWRRMWSEPDKELVACVRKSISDKHGFSPSAEQVAKIIVETTAQRQSTYSSNPASPEVSYRQDSKSQINYTLFGVSKSRSGIGVWADVVKEVYYRHENDFWEKAEKLRLTPGSRRVLISGDPQSINRSKPTEVPGLYIEYSLTQAECVNLAYKLLALFGHPPSDLQIHAE